MTLYLQDGLPALARLQEEGISAAGLTARPRSVRRIGLLNLMPDKIAAEIQFSRLIALTGFNTELVLLRPSGYHSRHTPEAHLRRYYRLWDQIRNEPLDGLIVTGAPVEKLTYESVVYWDELTRILDWCAVRRLPAMHICWSAQAALYHYHGVPKHRLRSKRFGIFSQQVSVEPNRLMAGLGPEFPIPVSRHSEVRECELPSGEAIRILAASDVSGLCIVEDTISNALCMFNHFEYDSNTLDREYARDLNSGEAIRPPFRDRSVKTGSTAGGPPWRRQAICFFQNWMAGIDVSRQLEACR